MGYKHSQVFYLRLIELAFLWFKKQIIFLQPFENFASDAVMLLLIRGVYKDVIKIDRELPFSNEVFEDVVHHLLKGRWCQNW